MGLFDWLGGGPVHPVPTKTFVAVPMQFWQSAGDAVRTWALRFVFTVRPDRLEDVAFVHGAAVRVSRAMRENSPAGRRLKRHFGKGASRSDSNCMAVPVEIAGTADIWVRLSVVPWGDLPSRAGDDDFSLPILWCRFGDRPRTMRVVERPADTVDGRARQRIERLRRRGARPVLAALVQANYQLFDPNGQDDLPCLVVFSPDESVTMDDLHEVAARMSDVKGETQPEPDLQVLSDIVTHETAVMYRRQPVPMSFTDGRVVYASDLWITRAFLPDGHLTDRELWCLAEPTDRGGLELLPQDEDQCE
jgi:hypothetical protein